MSGSGISWAICKSAPCSRQITTPTRHHSVFYRSDALPAAEPTESKHWRQKVLHPTRHKIGHFGDVLPNKSLGSVLSPSTFHNIHKAHWAEPLVISSYLKLSDISTLCNFSVCISPYVCLSPLFPLQSYSVNINACHDILVFSILCMCSSHCSLVLKKIEWLSLPIFGFHNSQLQWHSWCAVSNHFIFGTFIL